MKADQSRKLKRKISNASFENSPEAGAFSAIVDDTWEKYRRDRYRYRYRYRLKLVCKPTYFRT